jgi:hypothetical protein
MTTITTIAADSWSISIGGAWIVLMLVGVGFCFIFMLASMRLMRDGRDWAMCARWWRQTPPPRRGRSLTRRVPAAPRRPHGRRGVLPRRGRHALGE